MHQRELLIGTVAYVLFCISLYHHELSIRYKAFGARCLLAAIDHNHHITREYKEHQSTRETRFHRKYNKSSGQCTVTKVKVNKKYSYLPELMRRCLQMQMSATGTIDDRTQIAAEHLCHIAPTIAPIPPPPTAKLIQRLSSRAGNLLKR